MTISILPIPRPNDFAHFDMVGADEAALVSTAEAQRLIVVERHTSDVFGLRSELNRIDDMLTDDRDCYVRLQSRAGYISVPRWTPPYAPKFYWAAMVLMVLLEIPINAAAIDVLRLPVAESYMLASFFAIANLVAAKYSALAIRQWSPDAMPGRTAALAIVANLGLFAGLWTLADLRAQANDAAGSSWAFLLLQLMFYGIALLASFFQTPPCAEAELDARQLRAAERRYRTSYDLRAKLAQKYNVALTLATAKIRRVEHDCARDVAKLRASHGKQHPDAQPLQPITHAHFQPIDLGEPVDHHPVGIAVVVPPRPLA